MPYRMPTAIEDALAQLCAPPGSPRVPPRVLVVAAHPDDETIGAASRLAWAGRYATVIHVTDGSPPDGRDAAANGFPTGIEYAAARRRELEAAMAVAGVVPEQLERLNVPDQAASLNLAMLARRLSVQIRHHMPTLVLTHPYEGGHPDHDATAFAVHTACRLLGPAAPPLAEMACYHQGPDGLRTRAFLPADGPVFMVELSPEQRDQKRRMLDAFATQRQTLAQFAVDVERFRPAPAYNFRLPPHHGPLYYERFDWGMDGHRFRGLVRLASFTLGSAS